MGRHQKITFADISVEFEAGVPTQEIANSRGVCFATVYRIIREAGATRDRTYNAKPEVKVALAARAEQIHQAFMAGLNMAQIGEIHGMTRERIRQILGKHGLTAVDGGRSIGVKAREKARTAAVLARRDQRCMQSYGCSYAAIESICGAGVAVVKNPTTRKYAQHRKNAVVRGIEFNMTFPQWWAVWQASGKWNERGRGQGYVMARNGDIGSYSVGNVYICTQSQNSKDSFLKVSAAERAAKRAANPNTKNGLGSGKGWVFDKKSRSRPYQVVVRAKFIGCFATEEEAHSAYLAEVKRIKENELQPA